jgi:hypothetical protein
VIFLVQDTLTSVREEEGGETLYKAAEAMEAEYKTNKELTAFSEIDPDIA